MYLGDFVLVQFFMLGVQFLQSSSASQLTQAAPELVVTSQADPPERKQNKKMLKYPRKLGRVHI